MIRLQKARPIADKWPFEPIVLTMLRQAKIDKLHERIFDLLRTILNPD